MQILTALLPEINDNTITPPNIPTLFLYLRQYHTKDS